jgi:Ser/Thr protein kinase RdoA (MazF antagonist)
MTSRHRLFDTLPIDPAAVSKLITQNFNASLGDLIKSSQNYTYHGSVGDRKVIVRVTPSSTGTESSRIYDELHFILYVHKKGLMRVCPPIPTVESAGTDSPSYLVNEGGLIIVLFEYATGELVDFASWAWVADEKLARVWGRWTGEFHALSRAYAVEHPDFVARARNWDELHDSILFGATIDPRDLELISDPKHFGLLHADLNISNFFYIAPGTQPDFPLGTLHVFDWDQFQRGWFLYDLSSCVYFPFMLRGQTWLDDSRPVTEETYLQFTRWIVAGYESGLDSALPSEAPHKVDMTALERMLKLRKEFYERFCRRGLKELEEDEANGVDPKTGMKVFMSWVVDWLDREKVKSQIEG